MTGSDGQTGSLRPIPSAISAWSQASGPPPPPPPHLAQSPPGPPPAASVRQAGPQGHTGIWAQPSPTPPRPAAALLLSAVTTATAAPPPSKASTGCSHSLVTSESPSGTLVLLRGEACAQRPAPSAQGLLCPNLGAQNTDTSARLPVFTALQL